MLALTDSNTGYPMTHGSTSRLSGKLRNMTCIWPMSERSNPIYGIIYIIYALPQIILTNEKIKNCIYCRISYLVVKRQGNKDGERTRLLFYPRMILINMWIDRKRNLHKYGVIFSIYHRRRIQDTCYNHKTEIRIVKRQDVRCVSYACKWRSNTSK